MTAAERCLHQLAGAGSPSLRRSFLLLFLLCRKLSFQVHFPEDSMFSCCWLQNPSQMLSLWLMALPGEGSLATEYKYNCVSV